MSAISFIANFQMLASYTTLVNRKLFQACARLSDEEYRRERAGSFTSIHGTLNHLLLGDRIWMRRFSETGLSDTSALNTTLYDNSADLRTARALEDRRIETFVDNLDDSFLAREFRYLNNAEKLCLDPASLILAHFFNQTHHRGQVQSCWAKLRLNRRIWTCTARYALSIESAAEET